LSVVAQRAPHQIQRSAEASRTPAIQPGLASMLASKSSPAIDVPAGASKRIAAVVPRTAWPRGATTLRTRIPAPAAGRATSTTPPGQPV
jgi:hypothetical protein